MKIDKIAITNYRCFEETNIEFGREVTVLIGKNGTGKTTLLNAIKQALSFPFSKKQDEIQYGFIASSDQSVNSFLSTDPYYGIVSEMFGEHKDYRYPVSIETIADVLGEPLEWSFFKEHSKSGLRDSLYRSANERFWTHYIREGELQNLPILAYFSDSYPHIKTKIGSNIQAMLDSGNPPPMNTAYYKWDEEANCSKIWEQYFIMQYQNCKYGNGKGDPLYIEAVIDKLKTFTYTTEQSNTTLQVKNLEVEKRGKEDLLMVVFEDGANVPFSQLPQGYKRLFSILLDISNRWYLLTKGNAAPRGIVIIDEIDLHLHPALEQDVLDRFKRTFPEIQFIVTTHSPLVIANLRQDEQNKVVQLTCIDGQYGNSPLPNIYGIDYSTTVRDAMKVESVPRDIKLLKEEYLLLTERGDKAMSAIKYEEIMTLSGNNPQVIKELEDEIKLLELYL